MNDREKELILLNYEEQMDEIINILDKFSSDVYHFLELIYEVNLMSNKSEDAQILKLVDFGNSLLDSVKSYVSETNNIISANKTDDKDLKNIKEKYNSLEEKWRKQQQLISQLTDELQVLKAQLKKQSSFCAKMGATMGTILWKCCKVPNTVDIIVSSENLNEFIILANATLVSFMKTFNSSFPRLDTDEYKFVLSLCGTLTNVAAQQQGRQYILSEKIGLSFSNNIITYLKYLDFPDARVMKKMFLMYIYNLSINKKGAYFIQTCPAGMENIIECLSSSVPDLVELTVNLLISLLTETTNSKMIRTLAERIAGKDLRKLRNPNDQRLNSLISELSDKIEDLI